MKIIKKEYATKNSQSELKRIESNKQLIALDIENIKLREELLNRNHSALNKNSRISNAILDPYWKKFIEKFNTLNPYFVSALKYKHPILTSSYIELCSLMKLSLTNKDIALILNIEYRSVITKKQRLKKKLNLESIGEIEEFLSTLI